MLSNLLEHIPTPMKRTASTGGGEYKGPCPWCGGRDRFTVSPAQGESGLYVCRQCEEGGDGIDFLRRYHGLTFPEACERLGLGHKVEQDADARQRHRTAPERPAARKKTAPPKPPLAPPPPQWQEAARAFIERCEAALWEDTKAARSALRYLRGRGLTDETIRTARLGVCAEDEWQPRTSWGLPADPEKKRGGTVWLPRGIVIPWEIPAPDGSPLLWAINIRRPNGDVQAGHPWKGRKYQLATGSTNALYGAGSLRADVPAVMVEGELDALTIQQEAAGLASAVATGSKSGARRMKWLAKLAALPLVLVAFDADEAGEEARRYWTQKLPAGRYWRPYWSDASQMHQDGASLRQWVQAGLTVSAPAAEDDPAPEAVAPPNARERLRLELLEDAAPALLDLWAGDPIGPLSVLLWCDPYVQPLTDGTELRPGLRVSMELHQWMRQGIECGPGFPETERLRTCLEAVCEEALKHTLQPHLN